MFDSKDLARKALARADQIKKEKKRRRMSITMVCSALCICLVGALLLATTPGYDLTLSDTDQTTRYIAEPEVPLARPPTNNTTTCAVCGAEIEEQIENNNITEENEQEEQKCEQCKRE